MKKALHVLLLGLALMIIPRYLVLAHENCLLVPVAIEERVAQSRLIMEGKVIRQYSFWDLTHSRIYTANTVKVLKLFRGIAPGGEVEIITEGGTVGNEKITHSGTLTLSPGQFGIFFCIPNNFPGTGKRSAFAVYGSLQGFIHYDLQQNRATEPFHVYHKIDKAREIVTEVTGEEYRHISWDPALKAAEAAPRAKTTATPTISSFTPAIVTGGTGTLLTISGTNFGAVQGGGFVEFPNANDGGASYVHPVASDYILWSDNQIIVRVPSNVVNPPGTAGTGNFRVTNSDPATATSATPLTIIYIHTNIDDGGIAAQPDLVNDNGTGGYTFQFNTAFNSNTAAADAFERALTSWCPTQMNWTIGTTTSVNMAASDGTNVVRFDAGAELPVGNLGRLSSYYSGCGPVGGPFTWYVTEMDVVFDDGANWQFGPALPSFSQYDFESVALHELGHGIQLNHVIDVGDVMHYNLANGQAKRSLDADDIAGGTFVVTKSLISNSCGSSAMTLLPCPLPVRLLAFTGNYLPEEGARLEWTVSNEKDIAAYQLDRSEDGVIFSPIGVVTSNNRTEQQQYQYLDNNFPGDAYYRLGVKDLNGTDSYSKTVHIKSNDLAPSVRLYPNPVKNILLISASEDLGAADLRLMSIDGRIVYNKHMVIPGGTGETVVMVTDLAPGIYYYQLNTLGRSYSGKFVKQ